MVISSDNARYDQNSLFSGVNPDYVLALYQQYLKDSTSVSFDWQEWFKNFPVNEIEQEKAPNWLSSEKTPFSNFSSQNLLSQDLQSSLAAAQLVQAYCQWGHTLANLDPLNLDRSKRLDQLKPETYSLKNLDQSVYLCDFDQPITIKELIDHFENIYGQAIGLEFSYIEDINERDWLQNKFEQRTIDFSPQQKLSFFEVLQKTELLEQFLQTKFPGAKRFSVEGNDSFVPALEFLLQNIAEKKIQHAVIGMAHRGRISTMAQILHKPLSFVLADFHDHSLREDFQGSGDVKYHQGYNSKREFNGKTLEISILNNASHLESIVSIALGKTRYLQDQEEEAIAILVHGDASFMGQGVVAESLQLSQLEGYRVGGSLHIILNNQVGFTASPQETRSTRYCSDMAKAINCPIIHINADDVETVIWAFQLALDYRYQFQKDIVIDLVGYRRYGHNEGDEPRYTQPKMYKLIDHHQTVAKIYGKNLKKANLLTDESEEKVKQTYTQQLQQSLEEEVKWPVSSDLPRLVPIENFPLKDLKTLALQTLTLPTGLELNSKLERVLSNRRQNIEKEAFLDWSTAESLAFASLLARGHPIRLSGQDSKRGTFSQRHAEWINSQTDEPYVSLNHLDAEANFDCINSPLSEAAVVGFEYGYSLNLKGLTIWEGQFGDFVNGAQIIIDQYLSASYSKWLQSSNLVLLLPHGHEGQGPEHTSARLERFLQLSAQSNWRVVMCSTPANFYHLLRSQIEYSIPLIALTPKSLLRHTLAVSSWQDFDTRVGFQKVIEDKSASLSKVEKVIFCSGKIYYDLEAYRQQHNHQNIAILRLEQLYPFPESELKTLLKKCQAKRWIWCQEEPKNMGAWTFVQPFLRGLQPNFEYIGRPAASAPATGFIGRHESEQKEIIEKVFQ